MADDRHYVPGEFYRIDDRTGFKVRAKRTRMEWTGMIVSERVFENRNPQDFVKGVVDNQSVPLPRPRQPNRYINSAGSAQFEVFGDLPIAKTFLVQNSDAYDAGINAASSYTNNGTAQIMIWNGTIPTVLASSFPSNVT